MNFMACPFNHLSRWQLDRLRFLSDGVMANWIDMALRPHEDNHLMVSVALEDDSRDWDHKPVGWAGAMRSYDSPKHVYSLSVFVDPLWRGRRIGRRTLENVVKATENFVRESLEQEALFRYSATRIYADKLYAPYANNPRFHPMRF